MVKFIEKGDGFIVEGPVTLGYYCGVSLPLEALTAILRFVLSGGKSSRSWRRVRITFEPIEED